MYQRSLRKTYGSSPLYKNYVTDDKTEFSENEELISIIHQLSLVKYWDILNQKI